MVLVAAGDGFAVVVGRLLGIGEGPKVGEGEGAREGIGEGPVLGERDGCEVGSAVVVFVVGSCAMNVMFRIDAAGGALTPQYRAFVL